jgi:hypothetical protein
MAENWREATAKICFNTAMEFAVDLDRKQYEALHDGRRVTGLNYVSNNEFVIDRVGGVEERHFTDMGIEYYKFIA